MNNRSALIARACRGPVLLITVGALFAIQQAGLASFERTWPLLIIVVGLMKLLERVLTPSVPFPNAPYSPPYSVDPGWPPSQTPPPPPPPGSGVRR